MSRGRRDMTIQERAAASFDNDIDAFLAMVMPQEFWQGTLNKVFEASDYTAATKALNRHAPDPSRRTPQRLD